MNNKLYRDQARKLYNCVSGRKYHDDQKRIGGVNINDLKYFREEYTTAIQEINNRLTKIENDISSISSSVDSMNACICDVYTKIGSNGQSERVSLSLALPQEETRGTVLPNAPKLDSLLADVEGYSLDELDQYYNKHISPIVARNGGNLLAPISVTDLCSCAHAPIENITWEDLDGDAYIENKRAYIMQFILANRSNQTRSLYLTNKALSVFTLPLQ